MLTTPKDTGDLVQLAAEFIARCDAQGVKVDNAYISKMAKEVLTKKVNNDLFDILKDLTLDELMKLLKVLQEADQPKVVSKKTTTKKKKKKS